VLHLARAVEKGVKSVQGVEAALRRVAEFADEEAEIKKGKHSRPVWELQKDIPACTLDDLKAADGIIWGTPTRYGNMIAQMKRLIDSTAALWLEGAFEGKPTGVFTSTATTHGGQETTMLSMVPPLIHLGMIIVGVPYSTPGLLHTEGRGGTPYGPTTVAGPTNERTPAPEELAIAEALGKRVAEVTKKLRS
jgi:NAD(P)H dehydrogenase (quinone)